MSQLRKSSSVVSHRFNFPEINHLRHVLIACGLSH